MPNFSAMNLSRSWIYDFERKSGPTVDFYFKSIVNVRYISGTIPAETLNLPRIHTAKIHHMRPYNIVYIPVPIKIPSIFLNNRKIRSEQVSISRLRIQATKMIVHIEVGDGCWC